MPRIRSLQYLTLAVAASAVVASVVRFCLDDRVESLGVRGAKVVITVRVVDSRSGKPLKGGVGAEMACGLS